MSTKFLMGNEAIGIGALHAGVNLVVGYPGTPSTEVLETVAKYREEVNPEVYVEWSVNEKVALEVAAGASYAGARTLVTMKQVGLNVASDAIMSLAYIGIKGGMVVMVADDPGPISSQTEQDTRSFASFSKLPIFDPVSPEEAYGMIQEAFDYSEKYATPVLFRPTTRVCHGCATVEVMDEIKPHKPDGFIKNSAKWVIFPRLSYQNHLKIEKRNLEISEDFSDSQFNSITVNKKRNCDAVDDNKRRVGVATGGISYVYAMEILDDFAGINSLLKIGTPYPFPEKLALSFLRELDEVLVLEELDPVIERELIYLCGKYHLNVTIKGKISGDTANAGENSVENIAEYLKIISGCQDNNEDLKKAVQIPILPARPPVLCAGCPHRASFFAVKKAMKGKKAVFSGDIGCYTLGNAMPLDMVDTCLCMGAGITIAQGLYRVEPDTVHFAFVGDSTFFASGMTGIVNAVYNQNDIILVVLDNATTAMTGHQVHPGTGKTIMGNIVDKLDIEAILKAFGINSVETVNPLELDKAIEAVEAAVSRKGVKAIIFKSPCIAFVKPAAFFAVNDNSCIHCGKCVKELGCPAIVKTENGGVRIEKSLCYSCGVCTYVCPVGAISQEVM